MAAIHVHVHAPVFRLILCVSAIWLHYVEAGNAPYSSIVTVEEEYQLPELPYKYEDLEPYIDQATVKVHHQGHHAAYTKKMNDALKEWRRSPDADQLAKTSIVNILRNIEMVPEKYRKTIRNNGGGFVNHAIYWGCMSQNEHNTMRFPMSKFGDEIMASFGNFSQFYHDFTEKSTTWFGSGYVWLSRNPATKDLVLTTSANQDSPISDNLNPILVLDLWEHAYYLKYQNKRQDHVDHWWMVVDWTAVYKLDQWWQSIGGNHDEL